MARVSAYRWKGGMNGALGIRSKPNLPKARRTGMLGEKSSKEGAPDDPAHQDLFDTTRSQMDITRRFVRLSSIRADGYVEFVFSIGDPALGVDLILSRAAYDEFCRVNHVTFVTSEQAAVIDFDKAKWRFGSPGISE